MLRLANDRDLHGDVHDREAGLVERAELRILLLPEGERLPRVGRGLVPVDARAHVGEAGRAGERVPVLERVAAEPAELLEGAGRRIGRMRCRGGVRDGSRVAREREPGRPRAELRTLQRDEHSVTLWERPADAVGTRTTAASAAQSKTFVNGTPRRGVSRPPGQGSARSIRRTPKCLHRGETRDMRRATT